MSLVVAALHGLNRITIVSDTKLTWEDERRTRRTYTEALPKVVLLRSDLAVGVTGMDPHGVIEEVVAYRERPIETVLEVLSSRTDANCVIAALDPARLWSTKGGRAEERTGIERAWAGEEDAYNLFRVREGEWPTEVGATFRLLSSMQWLTSFNPVPTVGGYTLCAEAVGSSFQFLAQSAWVGPWILEARATTSEHALTISMSVPKDGDSTTHRMLIMPGTSHTLGALGLFVPEARAGWLFTHDQPWIARRVDASRSDDFLNAAERLHGQCLLRTL